MENAPFPIIVNRPRPASERLAESLRRKGVSDVDLIISPVIAIIETGAEIDLGDCQAVIFTSRHAVGALSSSRIPTGMTAYCVGAQTGNAARDAGFTTLVADGSAEALCRMVLDHRPQGPVLFARGRQVAMNMKAALSKCGLEVVERVVYVQEERKLNAKALAALRSGRCIIPLFSARTARIFGEQVAGVPNLDHTIVGISSNVVQSFPLDWGSAVAHERSVEGMSEIVVRIWKA